MRLLKTIILILLATNLSATNHYLSSTGNNAADGLTPATAKQTIGQLNVDLSTYASGDSVLFKRGDTLYGTFTISVPNLLFDAYGTGANPVITGFITVPSWVSLGSNIWESAAAVSSLTTCNYVLLNGKTAQIARQPNTGWLTIASHVRRLSATVPGLLANYTGFKYVQRTSRTIIDVADIVSTTSTTTLNFDSTKLSGPPIDGYGCFIQDGASICDTANEFYFNPTTKKLRVFSTITPVAQLATIDYLVNLNTSNITFKNIDFTGANKNAVYKATGLLANVNFRKCNFKWMGQSAIDFRPNGCLIDSCTITDINRAALNVVNGTVTITDNLIRNCGLIPGAFTLNGTSNVAVNIGNAQRYQATKYSFIRNQIANTGHNAVNFGFDTGYIAFNKIDSFNLLTDDGGAFYGGSKATIEYNTVFNGIGNHSGTDQTTGSTLSYGIYVDDDNTGNTIRYNTVYKAANAQIFIHNSDSNIIYANTVLGGNYGIRLQADGTTGRVSANIIRKNVLCQTDSTQPTLSLKSQLNDIGTFATLDSNIYNRVGITDSTVVSYSPLSGGVNITLASWRALFGQDVNSNRGPIAATIGAIDFYSNYSPSPITYNFAGFSKKDAFSVVYNNSASIPAWYSNLFYSNGVTTAPAITSFTSSAAQGQTITITGLNLTGATSVTLGGIAATIVSNTSVTITATVATGASGLVQVITPTGTANSSTNFLFLTPRPPGTDGLYLIIDLNRVQNL